MAERLCVCGHNEDWHRAIICGAARCDCEQYEQTTRIAELEADKKRYLTAIAQTIIERDRLRKALVEVREWARGRNQMLYMLTLEALNKEETK